MKQKILSKTGFKISNTNRRKAIRERCLNCSCWVPSEVSNCNHSDCPLYPYHTGKGKQNGKARSNAIMKY